MRYSLEPHYRKYVQGQGFMSLAKNIGNKYGKNYLIKVWMLVENMVKNMVINY